MLTSKSANLTSKLTTICRNLKGKKEFSFTRNVDDVLCGNMSRIPFSGSFEPKGDIDDFF